MCDTLGLNNSVMGSQAVRKRAHGRYSKVWPKPCRGACQPAHADPLNLRAKSTCGAVALQRFSSAAQRAFLQIYHQDCEPAERKTEHLHVCCARSCQLKASSM